MSDPEANGHGLLFTVNSVEWKGLPPWADFFFSVGHVLQLEPRNGTRTVLGVALPSRSFAAALAATGGVVKYLKANLESDRESYFRHLCTLPPGTGVTLLRNDKKEGLRQYPGVIAGLDEVSSDPTNQTAPKLKVLRIQVSRSTMRESKAGGRVFMVEARRADSIRVLDPEEAVDAGDLPATPFGVSVRAVSDFTRNIVRGGMTHYVAKSKVVCLIVGSLGLLGREINETIFGIHGQSGKVSAGTLGELLRVRRFSSARRQFHSDIFTAASKWPPRKSTLGTPDLVVFDGAAGFMKWRDSFPDSHLLVLLDQTENLFMEAVRRLNYEYSCRLDDDKLPDFFPAPPPGIELTFFREQIS